MTKETSPFRPALVIGLIVAGLVMVGMALTAHKTVAMFMHYVHTEDKPVRDAAELVANRRLAITGARRTEEMAI